MTGIRALVNGADYSAETTGVVGPYTSVDGIKGLFDLRVSHERSRYNHAHLGAEPCLLNRASPATFTSGHMQTTAVGQMLFPEGPLHNSDNTMFAIFEAHRAGGAAPQSPCGLSTSVGPNLRGQFMFGNGTNYLNLYTYTRADPDNFLVSGAQRNARYLYPTNGSLDNQMIFAAGVIRNGVGLDLYIPGVNDSAALGSVALTGSDLVFFGTEPGTKNVYDLRYRASAFVGNTEKLLCFGYAHSALSLAEINQLHTDLTAYYATHSLTFI